MHFAPERDNGERAALFPFDDDIARRGKDAGVIGDHARAHVPTERGIQQVQISDEMILSAPSAAVKFDLVRPCFDRTHQRKLAVGIIFFGRIDLGRRRVGHIGERIIVAEVFVDAYLSLRPVVRAVATPYAG